MKFKLVLLILLTSVTIAATDVMGQWVQTNGPYGMGVASITPMRTNYLASTKAGIYLSIDSAKSWKLISSEEIYNLATVGSDIFGVKYDSGIYRSNDSGISWTLLGVEMPSNTNSWNLAVIGTSLFANSDSGVVRSTNSGQTWFAANNGPGDTIIQPLLIAANETTLFADNGLGSADDALYRSNDSGKSWTNITPGSTSNTFSLIAPCGSMLFAECGDLFRSTNNGSSWSTIDLSEISFSPIWPSSFANIGTIIFMGSNNGVYCSTDSGVTWTSSSYGITNLTISQFLVRGTTIYVGTGQGIFFSTDSGQNWSPVSEGMICSTVNSLMLNDTTLFAGTPDGIFLSTDTASHWVSSSIGLAQDGIQSFAAEEDNIIAGSTLKKLFLSNDNGETWEPIYSLRDNVYLCFKIANNLFACGNSVVYQYIDNALTWQIDSSMPDGNAYAYSGSDIFAAVDNGIELSTDNGTTWSVENNGFLNTIISSLSVNSTHVFIGSEGIYSSIDSGKNWISIDNGLPSFGKLFVTDLLANDKYIIAGSDSGVFVSTNNGALWTDANQGLTDRSITSMIIIGSNLYLGTERSGVWRRPLSEMIGSSSVAEAPQQRSTITIYPNPVSHEATIGFSTNAPSQTSVTIFDVLGNEIAELFNGTLEAGSHSLPWDASTIPPGTYYARIATENGDVQTVKIAKN